MNNVYTMSEVIEIGTAQEVILGEKGFGQLDEPEGPRPSTDLDE